MCGGQITPHVRNSDCAITRPTPQWHIHTWTRAATCLHAPASHSPLLAHSAATRVPFFVEPPKRPYTVPPEGLSARHSDGTGLTTQWRGF
jgi:hypothetical protein